jgi:hypothetical protein
VKQSHIETNPDTGQKILTCYYQNGTAMFNDIIEAALRDHGLSYGEVHQIICKPLPDPDRCKHGMMSASVCHYCKGGQPSKDSGGKLPSWLKG